MEKLPLDMIQEICHKLDNKSLAKIIRTSKRIKRICSGEVLVRKRNLLDKIFKKIPVNIVIEVGTNDRWETIGLKAYNVYIGGKLYELDDPEILNLLPDTDLTESSEEFEDYRISVYLGLNYELARLIYEAAKKNKMVLFGFNVQKAGTKFKRKNVFTVEVKLVSAQFENQKVNISDLEETHQIEVSVSIRNFGILDPDTGKITYKPIP